MKFTVLNIVLLITIILFSSCEIDDKWYKSMSRPNFKHLNLEEFAFQFGDEIILENEGVRAIVLDFTKRKDKRIYSICFVKEGKILGQLAPVNKEGRCIDMLDFIYIGEPLALQFKKTRSRDIDIKKVMIGSRKSSNGKEQLTTAYKAAINERTDIRLPCNENGENVPSYFKIENYLK